MFQLGLYILLLNRIGGVEDHPFSVIPLGASLHLHDKVLAIRAMAVEVVIDLAVIDVLDLSVPRMSFRNGIIMSFCPKAFLNIKSVRRSAYTAPGAVICEAFIAVKI